MCPDARRRGWLAVAVTCGLLGGACKSEQEQLVEDLARQGRGHVPPAAVGGGASEENGLPLGYPDALALVPGYEAMGGGVDPGVIRTATLYYRGKNLAGFGTELMAALAQRGQRVVVDFTTPSGSRQMRVDVGDGFANLVLAEESGGVRLDVTMMEPRPR